MAYYRKRKMSATKKAYLAGKRAGYKSAMYNKKPRNRTFKARKWRY